MKLRTFGAALTGVLLAASLVACGGSQESTDASATNAASTDTSAEATTYSIATDTAFAPFEFTDDAGNLVGVDMDILAAVAEDQGFAYTINSIGFNAAKQSVQLDQDDGIIAGMSITDDRKETYDVSDPYYDATACCAVATDSDITSLDDLAGKNVAVKTGTQSLDWAESIKDQYGFTITQFPTSDVMYRDVVNGGSVACFEDTPAMGYAISTGSAALKIIAEVEPGSEFFSQYGFAVKKGENAELLQKFNAGLASIKASGKYDEIVSKWISTGNDTTATGATTQTAADETTEDAVEAVEDADVEEASTDETTEESIE